LRANIVSGSQAKRAAVPERRVVACVVIRIAAQDIEHQAHKQFL